jgi:hypothetical protein
VGGSNRRLERISQQENYNLCSLPYVIQSIKSRIKWAGCATYREKRNARRVLVVKPGGKKTFERLGHRWKDNINDSKKWGGLIWLMTGKVAGCC